MYLYRISNVRSSIVGSAVLRKGLLPEVFHFRGLRRFSVDHGIGSSQLLMPSAEYLLESLINTRPQHGFSSPFTPHEAGRSNGSKNNFSYLIIDKYTLSVEFVLKLGWLTTFHWTLIPSKIRTC